MLILPSYSQNNSLLLNQHTLGYEQLDMVEPLDWSEQNGILLKYQYADKQSGKLIPEMALISINGTLLKKISVPEKTNQVNNIVYAQIAPTDDIIHVLTDSNNFYRYEILSSAYVQRTDIQYAQFFDYYHYDSVDLQNKEKYNLVYSIPISSYFDNSSGYVLLNTAAGIDVDPKTAVSEILDHNWPTKFFQFSPDGRKLLGLNKTYVDGNNRTFPNYYDAAEKKFVTFSIDVGNAGFAKWHPSGNNIFYLHTNITNESRSDSQIGIIELEGIKISILANPSNHIANFVVSPDGKKIIYPFESNIQMKEIESLILQHNKRPVESPFEQFKKGVPPDAIQCRESLYLVLKYDDSPACVKPATKQKLIERGWAKTN